ncbi:MAG: hypothetical protein H6Q06_1467, partial [Acidobacteria bacterium]|nr:hypothetical protein [Acidobacteriota bacterium]
DVIGSHRAPQEPGRTVLKLGDAIACMELIRDVLAGHISAGAASTSYVDFLARMLPARARVEGGGASIIIPGR